MLFGRNGEFDVEDICDLRFCGRSIGLLVIGSEKEAPLRRFLTIQNDFSAGRPHRGIFCRFWFLCWAHLPRCFLLGGDDVGPDPMCQVGKAVRLIAKISR